MFTGCVNNNKQVYAENIKVYNQYIQKFDNIKNPSEYKKLLENQATYFQAPFFKDKEVKNLRSTILKFTYERLFVLEEILGDKYQADIYFRKAQYWELINMECGDGLLTTKEIADNSVITKDGIMKLIAQINPVFFKQIQTLAK